MDILDAKLKIDAAITREQGEALRIDASNFLDHQLDVVSG
jgi:hypothetical protein